MNLGRAKVPSLLRDMHVWHVMNAVHGYLFSYLFMLKVVLEKEKATEKTEWFYVNFSIEEIDTKTFTFKSNFYCGPQVVVGSNSANLAEIYFQTLQIWLENIFKLCKFSWKILSNFENLAEKYF